MNTFKHKMKKYANNRPLPPSVKEKTEVTLAHLPDYPASLPVHRYTWRGACRPRLCFTFVLPVCIGDSLFCQPFSRTSEHFFSGGKTHHILRVLSSRDAPFSRGKFPAVSFFRRCAPQRIRSLL